MLEGYEKLNIVDVYEKATGLTVEVNWNEKDEKTNECKVLKLTFPDGKEVFVKKEIFMSFLWLIGAPQEQQKMIPQTITRVKWYETVVSVKAKNDIKKGQNITFPIKISLPSEREEAIAEIKREKNLII